jgi:hypothetical protein
MLPTRGVEKAFVSFTFAVFPSNSQKTKQNHDKKTTIILALILKIGLG